MDNTKKLYKKGVKEFLDLMRGDLFTSDYYNHKMDLVTLKEAIVKYPEMVVELINDSINDLNKDMEECGICPECGGNIECVASTPVYACGRSDIAVQVDENVRLECTSCGLVYEE